MCHTTRFKSRLLPIFSGYKLGFESWPAEGSVNMLWLRSLSVNLNWSKDLCKTLIHTHNASLRTIEQFNPHRTVVYSLRDPLKDL